MICKTCGKELYDQAVICPGCGCPTGNYPANPAATNTVNTPAETPVYDPQNSLVPSSPIVVRYLREARLVWLLSLLSLLLTPTILAYPILALIAIKRNKELPHLEESQLKNEQDIFDYRLAQKKRKSALTLRIVGLIFILISMAAWFIGILSMFW